MEGTLEVHEWGVLSGGSLDASYDLLSVPSEMPDPPVVREPVIYFHSDGIASFGAAVVFRSGRATESYPAAGQKGSSLLWEDVKIVPDPGSISYPSDIIEAVNCVDSDVIEYKGIKTRSLFYEGLVEYQNRIRLIYNADRKQALIENRGAYPVYDLLLIVPANYNKYLGKNIYADVVPKVGAGETVTVNLKQAPPKADYAGDLVRLGYARKEAEAFANIWEGAFMQVEGGNGNLVYRLSEEEYDSLIELRVDPMPSEMIRTLYVFVHLTGKDTPAPPVIGEGFGIYQGQNLIIPEEDILSYNRTNHEIKLTESGLRSMRSRILYDEEDGQLVPKLGGLYLKQFTIRIDGAEIYSGTFWSGVSSSSNDGIVLMDVLSIENEDSVRLEAGYPSASNFKGLDPRDNTKIMEYLKEKNKLVE